MSYHRNKMTDLKQQIFQELNSLENAVLGLRSDVSAAGRQTDLEVAILTQQVKNLRAKNARAVEMIDKSMSILEKLKGK
ncbi:MAG: hypothetical protein MJ164_01710 [Alphaproteobacteria bacterium]|nr:hypothetical protein [Alphaproteobacteria bacterium]